MNAILEARYNLGNAYLNDEQYKEAIPEFEAVIQLDPNYIEAHCGLSRAYLELNDLDKAEISALDALKLNPDNPSVRELSESIKTTHYKNGITSLERNDYQNAVTTFEKVKKLDADYKDTNYNLGRAFLGIKEYEKAVDVLQSSITSNNSYDDVHYLIGNAYVELRQFQDAIQFLENAISKNPNQIEAHYYLARAFRESGNLEAATNATIETLRLDPKYQPVISLVESIKQTHYNNGISYLKDERYSEAIASLQNVITLDPDYTAAQYNLAVAHLKLENYSRALDNLQKTISLDPRNKEAHHSLALTFLGLGQLDSARNAARESLSIDPNYQPANTLLEAIDPTYNTNPAKINVEEIDTSTQDTDSTQVPQPRHEAHNATAIAYLDAGKLDDAISEFQKAIDLTPDYTDAHCGLAKAYFQNGQLDEAESSIQEALRIDQNSQEAKQLLDEIEAKRDADSNDEEIIDENIPQEDIDINKELERGIVYLNRKQHNQAIDSFQKIIHVDPNHIDAHSRLGETYLDMGDYDNAKFAAEKALALNPNHKPSQDIIKKIKFIQRIEINAEKRKKILLYASIVLVVLGGLFIAYRFEVFPFSKGSIPNPIPDPIPIPPNISMDAMLVNRYGKQSNQVFAGQEYNLQLKISNKGGTVRNLSLRIYPKSIKGLQFTIPSDGLNISRNKSDTINIKIRSNTRAVTSRNKLNITLVDSNNKKIAEKVFTVRVLGPDPID
ncbi:tetratricopeptide repeat protein [Candidatus Poribacteria bacterium]|nr:tetratricopeptide repeat protein [Candidatus Poribacteria bacterium]